MVASLREDEERLASREMASEKWRVSVGFRSENHSLAYWMALSRPPLPINCFYLLGRDDTFGPRGPDLPSRQALKALFFRPRPKAKSGKLFFSELDRLPPYGEEEGEIGRIEQGVSFVETFGLNSDKK